MQHTSAIKLYQSRLDPLTRAIAEGDVAGFMAGLHLPHVLRTVDTRVHFETEAELYKAVDYYIHALRARGVTRLDRVCESAVYKSDTEIEGYNSVHAFTGQDPAILPFLARMRLEFRDGEWRISETDMAVLRDQWNVLPQIDGQVMPLSDAPANEHDFHLACFQVLLNWLSQAALCKDFNAWSRACALPLTVTGKSGEMSFYTEEELRHEFGYYMASFDVHNVTDVIRKPLDVRMEGETRMVGSCRTYVLSNANLVVKPYDSTITFERLRDGFWQMVRMDNIIGHRDWTTGGAAS
ncbi:hypothetical protein [uncultured Pelagimonas sp.]|uniref:hypothetical protein n=1 Tax=uncultured Pelagimonas sp. TaxID=1618102 RepID=UPI00261FEBAF|nr:hypothetical protein [uncultured Pelagimonas sp.]